MQKVNDPAVRHTSSGALIRRFLPYLAKYKKTLFIDLFCAAMTTLCDIILPKIMSTITNSAMGVGITLTAGIVLKLAAVYFVLRIIDGAAQYFMSGIGHIMGVHIETDMRRDAFDHLLKLDHTYYNNTKVGTIMGRITNDLFDVTEFAHHCPEEFFIAGIKILASFLILCQASVPLTLAVFACVPLMGVVSVKLNQRLRARFRQQRVQIGELNATIEDSLLGQGVVKAFAAEDEEREKFARGNKDFEHIKTLGYYAMAAFNTSTRLFDGLMYLVVILAGGLSLVYGKITAGDMVAYMLYVTTLIATIRRIVEFAEQFQRGMTGIERFAEIMDTPVAIKDAPDAVPLQPGPGEIRFEKVCFEYPDDHNKVLHDVSLDIRAGERLALVGASGGGKTTLCNLIPRFYEVTSGRILIDGQDIRRVTLKSLRQDIGIVQQDVYLFSGTVAQNIAYGKPGATRQEIEAAARLAAMDQVLILTHVRPDGDTVGCAAALCAGLRSLGKTAFLLPNPELTDTTAPYFRPYEAPECFTPDKVVSTDIATVGLFPENARPYAERVDLAIDHHPSFESFGRENIVRPEAAACGELIYDILSDLGPITPEMALPLYVAISTDTGCFVYSNTTPRSHRIAAQLMDCGIDVAPVNKALFRTCLLYTSDAADD